ncbi:hypothetical protein L0244_17260 [bacterium]|nr:hypothetical protein [bacterium]
MSPVTDDISQLWSEIYREAIQLCDSIDRLPDQCECGDAKAHLEGRCRCCGKDQVAHGQAENCTTILTRLLADLSIFCQHFGAIVMPIEMTVGTEYMELRRGIFLTAAELQQIVKAVERVNQSVIGFRRTCDLSELRGLKTHSNELRKQIDIIQNKMDRNLRI